MKTKSTSLRTQEAGPLSFKSLAGTHLQYAMKPGDPPPAMWQHDLFHSEHRPYDPAEIALFRAEAKRFHPVRRPE